MSSRGQKKQVRLDLVGRHAFLTIVPPVDGPPVISLEVARAMLEALEKVKKDNKLRSLCLRSEGEGVFLAGGDLRQFASLQTKEEGKAMAEEVRAVLEAFEALPIPVFAAINGDCYGGGCELLLAVDFRVATKGSHFAFTQGRFGLTAGFGGVTRLVRLVGPGRAADLLLTGRSLEAREAQRIGLLEEVVEPQVLSERVAEIQASIELLGPKAVNGSKQAIRLASTLPRDKSMAKELEVFLDLWASEEHKEGLSAFFERRAPSWAATSEK